MDHSEIIWQEKFTVRIHTNRINNPNMLEHEMLLHDRSTNATHWPEVDG